MEGKRFLNEYTSEDYYHTLASDYPSAQAIMESEPFDALGDLVKAYLAVPHGSDVKYNADIENSLNLLCEWFGEEKDIRQLTRREMRNYRDNVLRKLPVNRKKSPDLRDKSLAEHLADTAHSKISVPSVNHPKERDLKFLRACWNHKPDWYDLINRLKTAHPVIEQFFCSGAGLHLQRIDSEIMRNVLTNLAAKNIPCLPVHDSAIVQYFRERDLRREMQLAYSNMFPGFYCGIERK